MRINSISTYNVVRRNLVQKRNYSGNQNVQDANNQQNVNFKGKLGAIFGGTVAAMTIIGTGGLALLGAPAAIAALGLAADAGAVAAGAFVGSKVEDKTNKGK